MIFALCSLMGWLELAVAMLLFLECDSRLVVTRIDYGLFAWRYGLYSGHLEDLASALLALSELCFGRWQTTSLVYRSCMQHIWSNPQFNQTFAWQEKLHIAMLAKMLITQQLRLPRWLDPGFQAASTPTSSRVSKSCSIAY